MSSASSTGIIGGADGPTAIYVASQINWPVVLIVVFAVIAIVAFCIAQRKKK